jgi:hypothetical protein
MIRHLESLSSILKRLCERRFPDSLFYQRCTDIRIVYRKIKKPSLSIAGSGMPLYFQRPPALESQTRPNLERAVKSLVPSGYDVTVTSVTLPVDLSILIEYSGQLKQRKED